MSLQSRKLWLCLGLITFIFPAILSGASRHSAKGISRVKVLFLARGTSIYSSFSGNQDDYLVAITVGRNAPTLAKLSHRYRPYQGHISANMVESGKQAFLRARRETKCDNGKRDFANAWIADSRGYAQLRPILNPVANNGLPEMSTEELLPCYILDGSGTSVRQFR